MLLEEYKQNRVWIKRVWCSLIRHMLLWHDKRRHLVISHSHTQYSGDQLSGWSKTICWWQDDTWYETHIWDISCARHRSAQHSCSRSEQKMDQTDFFCPYQPTVPRQLGVGGMPCQNGWRLTPTQSPITQVNCSIFRRGQQPHDSQNGWSPSRQ